MKTCAAHQYIDRCSIAIAFTEGSSSGTAPPAVVLDVMMSMMLEPAGDILDAFPHRVVTGSRAADLTLGRLKSTGLLADQGYIGDARPMLSRTLQDLLCGEAVDPMMLYAEAAEALITESPGK